MVCDCFQLLINTRDRDIRQLQLVITHSGSLKIKEIVEHRETHLLAFTVESFMRRSIPLSNLFSQCEAASPLTSCRMKPSLCHYFLDMYERYILLLI